MGRSKWWNYCWLLYWPTDMYLLKACLGVAKTLTAKLLSKSISVGFSRIQFTPDLMPSDVIGTSIFNPKDSTFQFNKGPIFSNIVLIR